MESPSVSLLLGVSVLLLSGPTVSAVYVDVRPNRLQFFPGESVSLSCVGGQSPAGWTLKRTDPGGKTKPCNEDVWRSDGSSCVVSLTETSDGGTFWCEDRTGQESDKLHIHVSSRVILDIPAIPVETGSDVTLRCRVRYESYKVSSIYRERTVGGQRKTDILPAEFVIQNVQQSDEGVYSCSAVEYDMMVGSEESRLRVKAPPTPPPPPPPPTTPPPPPSTAPPPPPSPPPPSLSAFRLVLHLVVVCPYCVSTALLVSICCSRKTGTGDNTAVSVEMAEHVEGVEYDDITADVITEHDLG